MKLLVLILGAACLCTAQLTSYCTEDAECNSLGDYGMKFCNTSATPGVCASRVPVSTVGTVMGFGEYCQDLWAVQVSQSTFRCMRGIRPGGAYVGDAATDACIHSSYDNNAHICRKRDISQADCDGSDYNCKLGYECIHTSAGNVCQNAGSLGTQCGGEDFGHSGCTNGACVGHTCVAFVEKGQRCQTTSGLDAQCPDYLTCNLGKCASFFSVGDDGHCTSSNACKSGWCLAGHCYTRKRNSCSNNAECDNAYCNSGMCWAPFQPAKGLVDCLQTNKINMDNMDNLLSLCPTQYGKYLCAQNCPLRDDLRSIPESLALSSIDCSTGAISSDSTAVANPSNIWKNCASVANYEDF